MHSNAFRCILTHTCINEFIYFYVTKDLLSESCGVCFDLRLNVYFYRQGNVSIVKSFNSQTNETINCEISDSLRLIEKLKRQSIAFESNGHLEYNKFESEAGSVEIVLFFGSWIMITTKLFEFARLLSSSWGRFVSVLRFGIGQSNRFAVARLMRKFTEKNLWAQVYATISRVC